jgi:hypothetical protein
MELSARLPALKGAHGNRSRAPRYKSRELEWNALKPKIQRLYKQITLKELMVILEQEDSFIASYVIPRCPLLKISTRAEISVRESQFKKKFQKWGLNVKNVKGDTMTKIVRTSVKRKRWEGKESMFTVKGNLVASQKIDRFTKRNKLSEEGLLSSESPIDGWLYLSLHSDILMLLHSLFSRYQSIYTTARYPFQCPNSGGPF